MEPAGWGHARLNAAVCVLFMHADVLPDVCMCVGCMLITGQRSTDPPPTLNPRAGRPFITHRFFPDWCLTFNPVAAFLWPSTAAPDVRQKPESAVLLSYASSSRSRKAMCCLVECFQLRLCHWWRPTELSWARCHLQSPLPTVGGRWHSFEKVSSCPTCVCLASLSKQRQNCDFFFFFFPLSVVGQIRYPWVFFS